MPPLKLPRAHAYVNGFTGKMPGFSMKFNARGEPAQKLSYSTHL